VILCPNVCPNGFGLTDPLFIDRGNGHPTAAVAGSITQSLPSGLSPASPNPIRSWAVGLQIGLQPWQCMRYRRVSCHLQPMPVARCDSSGRPKAHRWVSDAVRRGRGTGRAILSGGDSGDRHGYPGSTEHSAGSSGVARRFEAATVDSAVADGGRPQPSWWITRGPLTLAGDIDMVRSARMARSSAGLGQFMR
jgi:hypothetical protein